MLETFNPYQIEEKYGGKAKNVNCYWPPFVPDSAFSVNGKSELLNDKKDSYFSYFGKENVEEIKEEVFVAYKRHELSRVGSMEIKTESIESDDVIMDIEEPLARSDKEGSDDNLIDFEDAMPFTKNNERNPRFSIFSQRSSQEFSKKLSLKFENNRVAQDISEESKSVENLVQKDSNLYLVNEDSIALSKPNSFTCCSSCTLY